MYQQDLTNLIGLRADGRKSDEIRNISCKAGINSNVDGSAYFKIGLTEVICYINGPKESISKGNDQLLNVEYSVAPFSGIDHRTVSKSNK